MLRFKGESLPGYHDNVRPAPPELQATRTHYFGANGISELIGGRGGRKLSVRATLVDAPSTTGKLHAYLQKIDAMVGAHGDLEQFSASGTLDRRWRDCTFEGFEPEEIEGRVGPFVDFYNGAWTIGIFHFFQLTIEGDAEQTSTGFPLPGGGSGG